MEVFQKIDSKLTSILFLLQKYILKVISLCCHNMLRVLKISGLETLFQQDNVFYNAYH